MEKNRGPPSKRKSKYMDTRELLQRMRDILSNLHRETFEHRKNKLNKLSFISGEQIKEVMELIFEKAVHHQRFTKSCAQVCQTLKKVLSNVHLKTPSLNESKADMIFSTLLSRRCQVELKVKDERVQQKEQELAAATEFRDRQRLKIRLNKAKAKAFQRSMCNIDFICELYKVYILHEDTIHNYISTLLSICSPDSLEQVCRLLYLVGKDLNMYSKPCLNSHFTYMEEIIMVNKAPRRYCNMIKGLLDLHQNDWVPKKLRL